MWTIYGKLYYYEAPTESIIDFGLSACMDSLPLANSVSLHAHMELRIQDSHMHAPLPLAFAQMSALLNSC